MASERARALYETMFNDILAEGDIIDLLDVGLKEARKQAVLEACHLMYETCEHDALDYLGPHFGVTQQEWENWKPHEERWERDDA